ncbi:hypothetical protein B0A55_12976 [Friedmanniomyces simplex]|uniref:IBR domain-containing protein n=1 Tax=Friedmanniomyces simplex TaxID=329884 RepID=A0A4U0W362_9PEZI|nr:hypothetical protein B0A55_12976 [Friedmanniomyces simplex]
MGAYLDAEIKATLAADESFRWCIAAGCKSGQIHLDGEIFRCAACGHKACVECHVAWHEGETCAGYRERVRQEREDNERRVREEEASVEAIGRIAKLCPNVECKRKLEKIS